MFVRLIFFDYFCTPIEESKCLNRKLLRGV